MGVDEMLDDVQLATLRLSEHGQRCLTCIGGGDCHTAERLTVALRRAEKELAKEVR